MLSVIIPTYNEAENIPALLTRLEAVRSQLQEPFEVLIIDGGSLDATAPVARRLLAESGLGQLIALTGPADLARAVCEGMRQAQGDVWVVMDADLSHPPELIPVLAQAVRDGCEVAVASRYVAGGGIAGWPWHRRWLSWLGNVVARPLTTVRDATSGYFACRADVVRALSWNPTGFKILIELFVAARVTRVREVPYVFQDRRFGSSKLGARVCGRYLTRLLCLYAARWKLRVITGISV